MALIPETVPTPTPATPPAPAPTPTPELTMLEEMKQRLDAQSRIIAGLQKQLGEVKPGSSAKPGEGDPPPKKLEGVSALEEIEKRAMAREERALQKTIRTSILSAMVGAGLSEESAKKLIPAMQGEGKFAIKEDSDDEVLADDGSGARSVKDFVRILLQRDDWRALVPTKTGAKPIPRGGVTPAAAGSGVMPQPKEDGSYSAAELRAAAGIEKPKG